MRDLTYMVIKNFWQRNTTSVDHVETIVVEENTSQTVKWTHVQKKYKS